MERLIVFVSVMLLITVVGCKNNDSSDPKQVIMNFMEALGKKDVEGAKKYATKDSEMMLEMISQGMKQEGLNTKETGFNKNNMEFGDAKIEGNMATVAVKDKASGELLNYTLKKEDSGWKVAFDKATMMKMGTDKMKEKGMDMNDLDKGMDSTTKKMLDNLNRMQDSAGAIDTSR